MHFLQNATDRANAAERELRVLNGRYTIINDECKLLRNFESIVLGTGPFSSGREMDAFESLLKRAVIDQPTAAMQHFAAVVLSKVAPKKGETGRLVRRNAAPLPYKILASTRERAKSPASLKRQNRNIATEFQRMLDKLPRARSISILTTLGKRMRFTVLDDFSWRSSG